MKRSRVGAIGFLIAVLLLVGCTATQVKSVWKDMNYEGKPHKILTVAILKSQTNRQMLEDEFTRQLNKKGLDATASHTAFPNSEVISKEALAAFLKDKGFDTLLLVRLVGQKTQLTYVPGISGGWPGYYGASYNIVSSPGYTVEDRIAMAEAKLFDVKTEKLIWSAESDTMLHEVNQELIADYVAQIMEQMKMGGLLR
jgi:hypothetical protein